MRKKFLLLVLCLSMVLGNLTGLSLVSTAAGSANETVEYLEGSDLLYDLMETATTFVVAEHKALGGSHYAYTEGLYEESTGEAATGIGTESNFVSNSRLVLITLEQDGNRVKKTEKVILRSTTGCVRDPDVSADGTKLLFSWKQKSSDDFHLYEMDLTDPAYSYKQLTFGSGTADFEGQYLPNGDIIFSSSRAVQTVDCWKTPVSNLYKMSADGTNIVRLGYDQVHTTYPTTTSDGRVIYTRWDYNDRTQMYIQGLFQMNWDGTNQTELYGNNSSFPTTLVHVRQVPGSSTKYLAIATGHHTLQGGKLVMIDVANGRDGNNSVTFPVNDTANRPYNTKPNDYDTFGQSGPIFQYPYPLNDHQFLVSYSPNGWSGDQKTTPFGIYLMDTTTPSKPEMIELVKGTATYPAAQIVPVKTKDVFYRPSSVDYSMNTGIYYVHDVYKGEAVEGITPGSVKQIRVVALDYRPYAVGATVGSASDGGSSDPYTPISTGNGSWDVKVVLGVATVYEDGSAMFKVPSETPVYFQLLDKDGNMIQTMRSWSTLMPGEYFSCVGCHMDNNTAPPAASKLSMAAKAGVEELKPDAWQKDKEGFDPYTTNEGFSYLEEVQSIWDAKCISCHNNKNAAYTEINVSGMREAGVTASQVTGTVYPIFDLQSDWEYMTSSSNNPTAGWNNVGFTGSWTKAKAGFGDRGSDGAKVGTNWSGSNNWLFARKTFTIDDLSKYTGAIIRLNTWYDDTPVFYLNGHEIYTDGENWTDSYKSVDIPSMAQYLVQGENVLAVSINQHTGGRFFDTSLSLVVPDGKADPNAGNPFSLEGDNIGAERMARYFPLSYLVLTGSRPTGSVEWVGNCNNKYTKWLSSMSGAILRKPNSYGASQSNLMKILREGHAGVKLTDTELRTIAAWIDLCVPCYGEYDANNYWDTAEKREAEEEQNKRDYYVMLNDYARMSLAGTLPAGTVKITYKSGSKTFTAEGQAIAMAYVSQKIKAGDTVTVTLPEGVKYVGFTLSPKMGESIIYCPNGTFTYVVPVINSLVTTLSKSYANTTGYVTARILTDEELSAKRNLAENTYDYINNSVIKSDITGQYPHATADSEYQNNKGSKTELDFMARNAIDGFANNRGHGAYPNQSWGPANSNNHWLAIDFGRAVTVEELGIVIRYDDGHDTYFKSATVEFTYADGTTGTQNITIQWTPNEQIIQLNATKAVTKITIKNLVAAKAGGWAALTEVSVYGSEAK